MDIIQSTVLHRKGKKWKSRWAVFRITSSIPDSIGTTLMIYKDKKHAQNRQHKHILPLWSYAGCAVFSRVEKEENVLMIFTETSTIVLSLESQHILNEWQSALNHHFGTETTFQVVVPPKQKLKIGEATLYVYNDFFSLINNKSYRCIGRWRCSDLYRYDAIEGDFVFEMARSMNVKGRTFRLQTKNSDEIVQIFDYIKDTQNSETRELLQHQLNPGSGLLLDLEQSRRNTSAQADQNVLQRAFLRVSNRFRKHKRDRAATLGTQKSRRERLKELNQASTSNENGPIQADSTDGVREQPPATINRLPPDIDSKPNPLPYKARSNSHGPFSTEATRHQARTKAVRKQESLEARTAGASEQTSVNRTTSPVKKISSSSHLTRVLKSSVGSASGLSTGSRGVSMCSDVFDDDINETKGPAKSSKAPAAPPRSPISLGIFEFPPKTSETAVREARAEEPVYLNKKDLDDLTIKRTVNGEETSAVLLRRKTAESSLLEEIDREIKRRTRDNESTENSIASPPLSADMPYQYGGESDNDDNSESYVLLRTTVNGPDVSNVQNGSAYEAESREEGGYVISNGNHTPTAFSDSDTNVDPGVHSPKYRESEVQQTDYQNVSEIVNRNGVDEAPPKGRRNSSRRSSSKHLSDPILMERFTNAQQQFQDHIVTGSLREIHQEINYVNVKGLDEPVNDSSAYVNVAAGGPSERKLRKGKKPQPLNLNKSPIHWDKYDDDDKIYHDVGPLIGNGKGGSSDGLGSYKNITVGSYENIAGRGTRDRAYVNVPSPTHKKPGTMLNYVLVSGKSGLKGASSLAAHPTNKAGSLNSVNSYKSDYSMIDEKATSLLQKTREQHWLRREEDGQAKLNTPRKTKKSLGD